MFKNNKETARVVVSIVMIIFSFPVIAQNNRSFFEGNAHIGANLTLNNNNDYVQVKGYNGFILGGNLGFRHKSFLIRLQADYSPSSLQYTFVHPEHSNWSINFKENVHTISYGSAIGVMVPLKNNNSLNFILGFNFLQEFGFKTETLNRKKLTTYYDTDLGRDNIRLDMQVKADWKGKVIFAPTFGIEYKSIIKNIPFYIAFNVLVNENEIENNPKSLNFIAIPDDSEANFYVYKWYRTSDFRLTFGLTLFRSHQGKINQLN